MVVWCGVAAFGQQNHSMLLQMHHSMGLFGGWRFRSLETHNLMMMMTAMICLSSLVVSGSKRGN